ncbi:MAG: CaiB/BaiF CoA transferase family protein [Acidimicrobiales bacterium]
MGPLAGVKIIELFCIGPGPFAGMLLSDMGADVLRVDRPEEQEYGYPDHPYRTLWRNRRSVRIDLKTAEGVETLLRLVEQADGLIEGNRPGVTERMGIGPDACLARNPALVYGRMTGWGQEGPLNQRAGFDLNYISLTGALWALGEADRPPTPPLIMAGDFGGGGAFLALGMVSAILEARQSGQGQVVDAAILDGAANLMAYVYGNLAGGAWRNERAANSVDGGNWLYHVYECADGRYVSVAALAGKFRRVFLQRLGVDLEAEGLGDPDDPARWPAYRAALSAAFRGRTRDEWVAHFDGGDDCVAPVLDLDEAPRHPHNVARRAFVEHSGVVQPAPAPRFSRTPSEISRRPPTPGEHTDEALAEWGLDPAEIAGLRAAGAVS